MVTVIVRLKKSQVFTTCPFFIPVILAPGESMAEGSQIQDQAELHGETLFQKKHMLWTQVSGRAVTQHVSDPG